MNLTAKLVLSTLIGLVLLGGLAGPATAKYIGADARRGCCCTAASPEDCEGIGACRSHEASGQSAAITGEGGSYAKPVVDATGGNGVGIALTLMQQTSLADGEVATLDLGLGYGWSHSYGDLIFPQSRDLFRLAPGGSVTRYQRSGRSGGLTPTRGHRDGITENPDGSIDIAFFDSGVVHHYEKIPNNPLRVGGSVPWMLKTVTDRDGNQTVLTYGSDGLLDTVTGPYGRTIQIERQGTRIAKITDPIGRLTSLAYDGAGNLKTVTDAAGQVTSFTYNARHQFERRVDADGRIFYYSYDAAGNLVQVKDRNGGIVYRLSNNQAWATDSSALLRDKERVYVVDAATKVATTSITDGNGKVWRYHYNRDGYITAMIAPDGATTGYEYDPGTYVPKSKTDANGNKTSYEYDGAQRLVKETDAKGFETLYDYDDPSCPDEIAEITYPNGSKTSYEYNAHCNRIQETHDVGGLDLIRQWSYNADGTVATETDPNGHTTTHEYDAYGNRLKTTDPEGQITRYGYTQSGVPDYEQLGNRTCTVDGNGHVTYVEYDALDRVIRETAKIGTVVAPGDPIEPACTPADADDIVTAEYDYDGNGNQIEVRRQANTATPREWQVTTREYDVRNRLVKETQDPGGLNLVTTYAYDGNDNRTGVTDPRGSTTLNTYDVQNRPSKITDALGNVTQYGYDPVGNRIQETDANGHKTCSQYDELNRLAVQIRKMGPTSCALTAASDIVTRHFYDTGAPVACNHDPGSPPCDGPMPGGSNIAYTIDPEGKYSYFKYDQVERRWLTIRKVADTADTCDGDDWCEYTKYDKADNVVARIDANGNRTDLVYFANDWLASETQDPGGLDLVTSTTYDGGGNVATVTNPRGNRIYNTYDERDQLVKVEDIVSDPNPPFDPVATYAYDGIGNRVQECDGNGHCTGYSYDAVNRLIDILDPMGETALNGYDKNGNLIKVTDREQHVTCHYYDAINRRTRTAELMGGTNCALLSFKDIWTDTEYDAVGNVARLITARLNSTPDACKGASPPDDCQITAYAYDEADRLVRETYADATTRQFSYDKAGNLTDRVDPLGQVTRYEYNDLDYLMRRDYQDPAEPDDRFAYDIGGRMTVATKDYPAADPRPDWVVTFDGYDAANRLLQTLQDATGIPMVIGYRYDTPAGRRELVYPGGRTCLEQTDLRERLVDVACDSFDAQYAYDLGNRVQTRDYNNGVTATYSYNANNWITSLVHGVGGTEIADFGHDYDKEGNKKYEEKSPAALASKSEAYKYDEVYRLIEYKVGDLVGSDVPMPITQRQYDLDKVGNWDQFTVDDDGAGPGVPVVYNNTPNQMNEYDDWSTNGPGEIPDDLGLNINFKDPVPTPPEDGENWAHDKNGNRREDGKRIYEYDDENRLIRVTYHRSPSPDLVTDYGYDALGRRVVKTVDVLGTPVATRYASDDAREIEEQDALGATLATYVYGNYIDEVLNMQRGGADYYYHQNALWSVAAVTDASGNAVERYAYTDYGCPTITDGTGVPVPPNAWGTAHSAIRNPYLFTGRRWDEESGLYYYRARYYDCESDRFLQRDPIPTLGELNPYRYVKGNPLTHVDPSGLRLVTGSESYRHEYDWDPPWGVREAKEIGWSWRYDFCINETDCIAKITVRVKLNFDPGISTVQQAAAKSGYQASTRKFNGFKVCCKSCKCRNGYLFTVDITWVNRDPDVTVRVRSQSTVHRTLWGTTDPQTAAHEVGHQLGLRDEYGKVDTTEFGGVQAGKGLMNNPNENANMTHVQAVFDKGKLWDDFKVGEKKRECWLQTSSELCRESK